MNTLKEIIEDCKSELSASNCSLDDWTREKMTDLLQWYSEKSFLTQKQEEFLRNLWEKI